MQRELLGLEPSACCDGFSLGSKGEVVRLQLEFPESKVTELKAMMQKCGFKTYHDLFNNALTLTKWAIQETEQGRAILSQDDRTDKTRELVMPFLEFVAAAASEPQTEAKDLPRANLAHAKA